MNVTKQKNGDYKASMKINGKTITATGNSMAHAASQLAKKLNAKKKAADK